MLSKPTPSKPKGRPRKAAATIGIQKTAKVATTRIIKDVTSPVSHPLARVALVTVLGAIASYFIYKK